MHTNVKGAIAEQKVVLRALEKGYVASKPVMDSRYDLVVDDGRKLHRVQVKYANGKSSHSDGAVQVHLTSWDHDGVSGHRNAKQQRTYTRDEVDAIAIYIPKVDEVVWLEPEVFEGKRAITLRYEPSSNNQRKGIHFVEDFKW